MKKVDLIIKNANVLTLDSQNRQMGSVAVADGQIVKIWSEKEPSHGAVMIDTDTEVIDLQGLTLVPGFIATHNHILSYGLLSDQINCSAPPNKTIDDILKSIKVKTKQIVEGDWIRGYGYDDTLLDDQRHPTKDDLDKVSPYHPVVITHISGHIAVANSMALQLAGLNGDIENPKGGHFGRDPKGNLNGVLYEPGAIKPVTGKIPKPSKEQMISALGIASKDYMAQGITTNSDAGVGLVAGMEDLDAHLEAAERGVNPMRAQLMIMHQHLRKGEVFGDYSPAQLDQELRDRSRGLARLDSAKMFQDGSIQGLTGALRQPYHSEPTIYGDFIHDQEPFQEEVLELHNRGFRITTHGNGDRAIGSILDAYEYALSKSPSKVHRHRIEHVQAATTGDLDKMQQLGVAGSFFINHVYYWGDRHERIFLGPERASRISALKDAVDRNLIFTLHSDCPVTPISPLFSVWAAVNRLTREGRVLGSEQRIDVVTALKAMTIYGAQLNFDEQNSGSLEVGKRADFAVLNADPTTVNPEEIKDITVNATFIDGVPVYGQEKL
ncbi:amidohydrolase [Lentibacillus sp.]|uniref:amidohydrolase n=1 Tax=Lentibacillus sp. TaxID=1925746 RepID=UPI002B4AE927|nr:amidohydrolase [Lentibacillus sp.]HLS09965.1 amidohydrolase [Lentibacillus sp.]